MRSWTIIGLGLALGAGLSHAATTARLVGRVTDTQGVALPGVTVVLSSDALIGGTQAAVTGSGGEFAFRLLPVGVYRVEADLVGFEPVVAEGVRVRLDRSARVDLVMVPERFGGEIEVTAEVPVVDTTQVNAGVVFDQDYLQKAAVGSGGRDYLSVLHNVAGVAGVGDANPSVYGGSISDNAYLIDGLNTTDPALGTFGTNFNFDAIQEISFQTGGFEAEFGQATGGIVNLVTKSGGNELSGSADLRYRDQSFIEAGDHYDPDAQTSWAKNLSLTLGGPVLRDTLWFFVSGEHIDNSYQQEGDVVPWNFKGQNYIGKLTWQVGDGHRLVAKYSDCPADIPGINASRYMTVESSGTQTQGNEIWQAELGSLLGDSALLDAQAGTSRLTLDRFPTAGDDQTIGQYNQDTGVLEGNYPFTLHDVRRRDQLRVSLSLFLDDLAGVHELKAGAQYDEVFWSSAFYYNGGAISLNREPPEHFVDVNGDGYLNEFLGFIEPLETAGDAVNAEGTLRTVFLQDAWRPLSRLTLKPGIRMDNVSMENHVGEPVADMDRWQPRLGVSWDITGESRHVVRASWGRFMDPTALSIPGFASGVVSFYNEYVTAEHWCNRLHLECTADDIAFLESVLGESWTYAAPDGTEYVLWLNPEAAAVDEPAWTLDQARRATGDDRYGSLAAPYADELIVAYEAQVAPSTSIELSYVNKRTDEIIEDTCINNEWAFDDSVPPPSLDDPSTWTSAAGCSRWLISNPPGFYRTYEAWIGKLETRRQNLHLMASYTWAESWGTTPNGAIDSYATGLADFYPLNSVNQAGWMPGDRRHRVRLSGYWLLPHDITLGFEGWWSSAYAITVGSSCSNLDNAPAEVVAFYGYDRDALLPYCTTSDEVFLGSHWISLEPRGATRTKPAGSLDLQVSKGFTFGGVRVEGILSVLNVLGRELDDSFNSVAYRVTTEEYGEPVYDEETGELIDYYMPIGQPLGWHAPRRYELGFRVEF